MSELTANQHPKQSTALTGIGLGGTLAALWTLFLLTLRQHSRGRRLLLVVFLFLLPAGIAVLIRSVSDRPPSVRELEEVLIFSFMPYVLIPLSALLYASNMIQDEIEEQTLTYLLIRPIPRWALYLTKLLATWLLTATVASLFTMIAFLAIYGNREGFPQEELFTRAAWTVLIFIIALSTYNAIFGLISLFTSRTLVAGIAYLIIFEGILANQAFFIRQLSVMYYVRVLSLRWVGLSNTDWSIDLEAPNATSADTCLSVLLGVALLAAVVSSFLFSRSEFRVKTPEGS